LIFWAETFFDLLCLYYIRSFLGKGIFEKEDKEMKFKWFKKTALAAMLVWGTGIGSGCDPGNDGSLITDDRTRSSARLIAFDSCEALEAGLKAHLKEEMKVNLLNIPDKRYFVEGFDAGDVPEVNAPTDDGGREEGVDYSGTNTQEVGVDEADFVKTDGYYIYVLNGEKLVILGVPEFGRLVEGSSVELEGYPIQMLLSKEESGGRAIKAVIFSTVSSWNISKEHPLYDFVSDNATYGWYYRSTTLTKLTVIDLNDPDSPRVVRELYLEGYYQTARKVVSSVHMIAYSWMDVPGLLYWPELPDNYYQYDPEDPRREAIWSEAVGKTIAYNDELIDQFSLADLVPRIYELTAGDEVVEHDFTGQGCQNFTIAEDGVSRGFSSILSLDLLEDEFEIDAEHIVSNWSTVYASTDTLIIAEPAQDWWWYWGTDDFQEATNIHRFAISTDGTAQYSGSGRVDGTVLDQFSLSEYEDYIRVAATTGQWNRWWLENPEEPENHVYVLAGDESLDVVGRIDGIAVGERIWSARFIGNRGYLVTFRNIDPLWTIDLSVPQNPVIMGELEVPGVSTYIHPLGENHLLTIGFGGDEEGLDRSTRISIFDVSDFDDPRMTDNLTLNPAEGEGWEYSWGWSEATYEHKAFQYWEARNLLAVPLSTSRYISKGYDYFYEYVSFLKLISVDTQNGLEIYGSVDHSGFYNSAPDYYWYNRDIRRSIFMGDYIYAISERGVTASNLDNMTTTASVELPGSRNELYPVDVEADVE